MSSGVIQNAAMKNVMTWRLLCDLKLELELVLVLVPGSIIWMDEWIKVAIRATRG